MSYSPIEVLNEARRAVPAVNYAIGIAGIAVACAIVIDLLGESRTTLLILGSMLVGRLLLFLLGRLMQSESPAINVAAIAVTWGVALFFMSFLCFTTTAAAFYWPQPWAEFLGLSKKNAPLYFEGRPSFSCFLDRNPDEQAICQSATLSEKDVKLAALYQELRQKLPAEKFQPIHDAEVAWVASRRNCGDEINCINQLYDTRLTELEAALRAAGGG
jgi:hypothetical protein